VNPDLNATASQPRQFLPLRPLAAVLIVLVAADVALTAANLVVQNLTEGDRLGLAQMESKPFIVISQIAVGITEIVFLIWFRRAKINTEHIGSEQRYGRGWAFWGWIVPVVNFWIPFQIMDDLLRASRPTWSRAGKTWLPLTWWISWTLFGSLYVLQRGSLLALGVFYSSSTTPKHYGLRPPDGWPSFCLFAVAGLTCIALIRAISQGELGTPDGPAAEPANDSPAFISLLSRWPRRVRLARSFG